jgi:hypothetical protein
MKRGLGQQLKRKRKRYPTIRSVFYPLWSVVAVKLPKPNVIIELSFGIGGRRKKEGVRRE